VKNPLTTWSADWRRGWALNLPVWKGRRVYLSYSWEVIRGSKDTSILVSYDRPVKK